MNTSGRKTAVAALCIGAIIGLVGCSTTANSQGESSSSAPGVDVGVGTISPKTDSKKLAAIIFGPPSGSYAAAQEASVKKRAAELGYDIDVFSDDLSSEQELANFQHVIADGGYAGLVLEPSGTQLCTPLKDQTLASNLLVAVVALGVCDDGSGSGEDLWAQGTLTFIGGQANRPGPDEVLKQAVETHDGPQKVAIVVGAKGHPASDVSWETAWAEFSKQHPDWTLVDTIYTDWTVPDAFAKTQNLLTAHPDVDIVFDSYVDIAQGVAKAVESRELQDQVSVYTTIGGNDASVAMIESGQLAGMLPAYPSSMMAAGVDAIDAALKGKAVDRFIGGDGNPDAKDIGVVTKDNVADYTPDY